MARVKADPRVEELLDVVKEVIDPLGVDYAIGGAMAMASHGYARFTSDVDVFAPEASRYAILNAMRRSGFTVGTAMDPHHYFVMLPQHGGDPDVRIDLMFPAAEPDISAAEYPVRQPIFKGGDSLNVVEPSLLAMMKFYSDRDIDEDDLKAMYRRGIFDPDIVRQMIESIDNEDGEDTAAWDATIERFRARRVSRPKPKKKPKRF